MKEKKKQDGGISGCSQEELDMFSQRYIWDEENKILYEVVPRQRKIQFGFFQWTGLIFCALLFIAAAAAMLFYKQPFLRQNLKKETAVSVLSKPAEQQEVATDPAETAEATPCPQEAVEIVPGYVPTAISIDSKVRGILASQEAAHAFIDEVKAYYAAMTEGEGELTVELTQNVQLLPMPNATAEEIVSYEDLFASFTRTDTPIKVQCTWVTTTAETVAFKTKEEKDPHLLKGTRIVVSEGRDGEEDTIRYNVYINGKKSTSRSGTEKQVIEGQDRVIRVGSAKITGEDAPGKSEGKKGKSTELAFVSPIDGEVSSNYGERNGVLHLGLDYKPKSEDADVLASCAGTVVCVMERGGYGLMVEIDHGDGFVTRYAHLSSACVILGQTVAQGAAIGKVGNSGNADSVFLQFELRIDGEAYNPRYYVNK